MKSLKKLLISMLSLACLTVTAFAFASCDGEQEIPTYTVTFYTDGGNTIAPQTVEKGEKAERPQIPTKEGYTFMGWYCGDEEWSFVGYTVTEDITLTARWREEGYGYEFEEHDDYYEITGCYLFENELVLPSRYNGKPVKRLGAQVFKDCNYLFSVVIPEGIEEIGFSAFENCDNLSNVEFSLGVKAIRRAAFKDCNGLKNIILPEGLTILDDEAFSGCKNLQNVKLSSRLTYISYKLFKGCESLTDVTLGDSITNIYNEAFCNCTNLTKIVIPKDVTSIGDSAFYGCAALTEIILSGCLTSIGNSAFYGCKGVTEIFIPNSVTSIGDYAFFYCSLESVIIPDTVMEIGENAFIAENSVTVYCEVVTKPSGWKEGWWGYEQLTNKATVYWYSEMQPTQEGNYWRYVDGLPVAWQ